MSTEDAERIVLDRLRFHIQRTATLEALAATGSISTRVMVDRMTDQMIVGLTATLYGKDAERGRQEVTFTHPRTWFDAWLKNTRPGRLTYRIVGRWRPINYAVVVKTVTWDRKVVFPAWTLRMPDYAGAPVIIETRSVEE